MVTVDNTKEVNHFTAINDHLAIESYNDTISDNDDSEDKRLEAATPTDVNKDQDMHGGCKGENEAWFFIEEVFRNEILKSNVRIQFTLRAIFKKILPKFNLFEDNNTLIS